MITFKKIRYKNFLSTGNVFTEIQLNKHKNTLIIGENGSGKSTVLEAISYALYGKPMRNINKPLLVNSITQRHMLVEIEFSVANKNYMVRRGMKPTVFEIYVNEQLVNQDSASRDYQEYLETQILKLNHKSFSQVVMLSIANYTPFMKLTAAGRREVIEDLLDIQIFSVMNSLLKDKIMANRGSLLDKEYDIKLITNKIEMHKKHLAEISQNNVQLIKQKKAQIKEYEKENKDYYAQIQRIQKDIEKLNEKLAEESSVQSKLYEKTILQQTITTQIKKLREEVEFYQSNATCPTCKQSIDEEYKSKEIEKKYNILDSAKKALATTQKLITKLDESMTHFSELQEKVTKKNTAISEVNAKISSNLRYISSVENEILSLEEKIQSIKDDNEQEKALNMSLEDAIFKKEELIKTKEVLSLASQLLKDGGIKTKIIKQYIPVMNKLINKYLASMDFFVDFQLDETFKETIKSRFRDEFTYDSFSQGEKLRIDLALLFAWRAIAKIRNSSSTNLLFMDEILDSSLDSGGVEEFLRIISQFTHETNTFIISHRGDQMIDKFEHVIKFQKIKNFSKIAA